MDRRNKWVCMMAYTIFFIPMLVDKDSISYRFHSSQGFNLLIFSLIISFFGFIVPVIGWFIILPIGTACALMFWVIGLYNAFSEKDKELPMIGKYKVLNRKV